MSQHNDQILALRSARASNPDASFDGLLKLCEVTSPSDMLELACIDLIDRFRKGKPAQVEDYLQAVPELQNKDDILDLLDAEICVRKELGETPRDGRFVERFPEMQSEIERLFAFDLIESTLGDAPAPLSRRMPEVPGFQLKRLLFRDECSTVYRAKDNQQQPVLLRLFNAGSRDDEPLKLALRVASELKHPNLLSIEQLGASEESLYYTTTAIDAPQLRTLLDRPPEPGIAAEWARSIAAAMVLGLEQKMPLGAVKTSQVLIDHSNQPQIIGFGQPLPPDCTPQRAFGWLMTPLVYDPELPDAGGWTDPGLGDICARSLGLEGELAYSELSEVFDDLHRWLSGKYELSKKPKPGVIARLLRRND